MPTIKNFGRLALLAILLIAIPFIFLLLPLPYSQYLFFAMLCVLAIFGVVFLLGIAGGISFFQKSKNVNPPPVAPPPQKTNQDNLPTNNIRAEKMQAIGQLAGGIAHDFNNVLTAIIGLSDLLLSNHRPSDPSFPDIMGIKQEALRASTLVKQLLAFSRRQTLRPKIISISDTLSDFRLLLNRLLGEKVKLELKFANNLWQLKLDDSEFQRVIINLCTNARDAILSQQENGKIEISTSNLANAAPFSEMPKNDYVVIEVKDNGGGIASKNLPNIFNPFFSTKTEGEGTGLGLSTAYGIIKQSGGFIYAKNNQDENGKITGAIFTIYLPRHKSEPENKPQIEVEAKNNQSTDLSGTASLIFVEDEDSVRAIGTRTLQARGYTIFAAANGVEALKILEQQKNKIDLIVSDVVMPEMDGPTLLKKTREQGINVPFIFASGYAENSFEKNLISDEKFTFIAKPYNLKSLATVVKQVLASNK